MPLKPSLCSVLALYFIPFIYVYYMQHACGKQDSCIKCVYYNLLSMQASGTHDCMLICNNLQPTYVIKMGIVFACYNYNNSIINNEKT